MIFLNFVKLKCVLLFSELLSSSVALLMSLMLLRALLLQLM